MKNEDKIVELLSEMLHKFDVLTDEVKVSNIRLSKVEDEIVKMKGEIVKLNLISSENSLALMKLADNNDRIVRLEKAVFK